VTRNLNYTFEKESRFDSPKWPSKGRSFDARIAPHDLMSLIDANRGAIKTGETDAESKKECPECHSVRAPVGRRQRGFRQGPVGGRKPESASEGRFHGDRGQRESPARWRKSQPLIPDLLVQGPGGRDFTMAVRNRGIGCIVQTAGEKRWKQRWIW
jgi:hypothetical protein